MKLLMRAGRLAARFSAGPASGIEALQALGRLGFRILGEFRVQGLGFRGIGV